MDITFPFFQDIYLRIGPIPLNGTGYPSSELQKGLILISNGQDLTEEGVGFGVPVLMKGLKTIFAGDTELTWLNKGSRQEIVATFIMNLEESLSSQSFGIIKSRPLYGIKNRLADLHRRFPLFRGPLTSLSTLLRRSFGWQTTYKDAGCNHAVDVIYTVDLMEKTITVAVDATGVPTDSVTDIIVMNELGARYFDVYTDSSGLHLQGEEISSWDKVASDRASFLCYAHRLAFTLPQIEGAILFRGRELIGSRLAWAGFGYSLPPSRRIFAYTLMIERLV